MIIHDQHSGIPHSALTTTLNTDHTHLIFSSAPLLSLMTRSGHPQSSDPMPSHLAHGPGRSGDTEAQTNTAQGAPHADGAGTGTI